MRSVTLEGTTVMHDKRAGEIIRNLLMETTYPAWTGDNCRSCKGGPPDMGTGTEACPGNHSRVSWDQLRSMHQGDCPYLQAITKAQDYLQELAEKEQ